MHDHEAKDALNKCSRRATGGLGRSAALQILVVATATTAVCALHPIPIRKQRLAARLIQSILKRRPRC